MSDPFQSPIKPDPAQLPDDIDPEFSNLGQSPEQFLEETFEFERCAECGGAAQHHEALPVLGNWFARCLYAPDDAGNPHPIVAKYIAEEC